MHTLFCVIVSLPLGIRGWLRLLLVTLPGHSVYLFDIRQNVDITDEEFLKAFDNMAQYLDIFNRSVSIDSVFLKQRRSTTGCSLQTAKL